MEKDAVFNDDRDISHLLPYYEISPSCSSLESFLSFLGITEKSFTDLTREAKEKD